MTMRPNMDTTRTPGTQQAIPPSLRALLANIIDYAGLFPPAALPLSDVVKKFANYVECPDAWMLGRLILPTAKLEEFETLTVGLLPRDEAAEPWRISALVKSASPDDLDPALQRIDAFNRAHAEPGNGRAVVETIELKAVSAAQIDAALDAMPDALFPFFEIASDRDPRGMIATLPGSEAGAKLRTGGVTPDLYPTVDNVTRFIQCCAVAGVPFKATAGLHHPLRHRNTAVGADEFGFLNVFIGACAAKLADIDVRQLTELLAEASIDAFTFADDAITWQDVTLDAASIDDCRDTFAISFGSCSFDEPRDDLRDLKLLAAGS